jgi:dihydroorotate dehydrogenase
MGRGSLSGPPALPRTLQAVQHVYRRTGTRAALIAQGGITTGRDAWDAIAAGASAVGVYSGFIYRGPSVAKQINAELLALLRAGGVDSVARLRGRSAPAAEPSRAVS